jgi:hypothetical protein
MPDLQEVFRMATQKVGPDPGALDRQLRFQRRTTTRRKLAAFAVAAAIGVAGIVLALVIGPGDSVTTPADDAPTENPPVAQAEVVGTVTFDGSTCSMEITADRIEWGAVLFEAVNASDQRVMFDSWQLLDGYTVRAFEATIERDRSRAEPWIFPDQEREVSYLGSELIPANSSGSVVTTMSPGSHAIVCMERYEGEEMNFRPFGVVGPIIVR